MGNKTLVSVPGHLLTDNSLTNYVLAALVVITAYLLGSHLNSPLRQYPGPALAKCTNLWRLYHTSRGSFQLDLDRLHKKYGPVVRIGPNILDVNDPTLLKTVFGTKGEWEKTGLYHSASALINGRLVHNIFSQPDEAKHSADKKLVAKYYSPTGVACLEPLIDKTIAQLCDELDKRFTTTTSPTSAAKAFDLGDWISYYAWDVVGTVTFSQPLGYLSAGTDFDGTLHASEKTLDYFAWVGCMPFLDTLLEKNRVVSYITTQLLRRPGGFNAVAATCVGRLIARYQDTDRQHHHVDQPDYLDHFLEIKSADPTVSDGQIVS